MLTMNQLIGFGAGGLLPGLTGAYVTNTFDLNNLTSYSFASVSIGAVPAAGQKRYIVIVAGARLSTEITDITVAGLTCSLYGKASDGGQCAIAIGIVEVPTGTTATITVASPSGGTSSAGIGVYRLITTNPSISIHQEITDTVSALSLPLSVPAGSYVIGGAMNGNGTTNTWTVLTENFDIDTDSSDNLTGAALAYASASSITPTLTIGAGAAVAGAAVAFKDT